MCSVFIILNEPAIPCTSTVRDLRWLRMKLQGYHMQMQSLQARKDKQSTSGTTFYIRYWPASWRSLLPWKLKTERKKGKDLLQQAANLRGNICTSCRCDFYSRIRLGCICEFVIKIFFESRDL